MSGGGVLVIEPDRKSFSADPIGYSGLAWHKWETAKLLAGVIDQPRDTPTKEDLKSPVLWLSQAHALSEAALVLLKAQPTWESMPFELRGMCDSQYCAVGLMLVGYSLETCLKAMHIMKSGIDDYFEREKKFHHHRLDELATFLPDLSEKDKAILRALTHFTLWAGRYPDPGADRLGHASEIFTLAESHEIAGRDLFALSARVMKYVQTMTQG